MRLSASTHILLTAALASGPILADSKKLTEDQRIEILRGLMAEYAKIIVPLPVSRRPLEVNSDGTFDQAKWKETAVQNGPTGRVGDMIQVTHIDIDKDRIVLQLNGGGHDGKKWYDHVQIGMGNNTSPIGQGPPTNAAPGTTVALVFGGPIGEVTSKEVKAMLRPVLDFEKTTIVENAIDSLPEPVQEAVRAKKAIEGMTHDQVLMAIGRPFRKTREPKNGQETEDWIYGEPPGRVTFVTFIGDKVTRVKETYAGLGGSVAGAPEPSVPEPIQ